MRKVAALWLAPSLLAVALGAACSAEKKAQPSSVPNVPLTWEASMERPAPPAPLEQPSAPVDPLNLNEFAPLLAQPALAPAAAALEKGRPAVAVRVVEKAMATAPPSPEAVPAWQYLLGRLREEAGDLSGAAASYELSAAPVWPLAGYSLLGAGRVLLRGGRPREAIEVLARVPTDQPIVEDARLLIAEAAVLTGDRNRAIATWREHLAHDPQRERVSISLRLAEALLERLDTAQAPSAPKDSQADAHEAARLAREVSIRAAADPDAVARANEIAARAIARLPVAERAHWATMTRQEQVTRLEMLIGARRYSDAEIAAQELYGSLSHKERSQPLWCEAAILRAKALAGVGKWGKAADFLSDILRSCREPDARARALYLAGKYSDADKRYAKAVGFYQQLENELPTHRLADDARLLAAISYFNLGAEARFTELLNRMPDDYPTGDMVLDGVFRLATRRIEKGDWVSAVSVLERGTALAGQRDRHRGHEFAGRERYFLARARYELGERERALDDFEVLVRDYPFSYYMLGAYSWLSSLDSARARKARETAVEQATRDPFHFESRPEFHEPGFQRALELLRQGEVDLARRELKALGVESADAAPSLLWGVALFYGRAGAARLSHAVARGLLTDWLERWPAGEWQTAWQLAFPRPYHDIVKREAKRNGVPEHLVYAVMREESAFEPTAESPADAYGLMQLIVPTARHYAKKDGLPSDPAALKKPSINIALGCRVLADLGRRFESNPLLAIPGYNAGPGRPRRWVRERAGIDFDVWVELIPFRETRRYTKRVLASRAAYAFLYDSDEADATMRLPLKVSD